MFVERGSTTTLGARKPVDCAPDGSWLRIHDREYKFRAGKKDIILMLFKTWECGDEWVPVSRLLEDYGVGNVIVGYGVAVVTQILIFPIFGLHTTLAQNLKMGAVFTVVSIARSFTLRRLFEAIRTKKPPSPDNSG